MARFLRKNGSPNATSSRVPAVLVCAACAILLMVFSWRSSRLMHPLRSSDGGRIKIFTASRDDSVSKKQRRDIAANRDIFDHVVMSVEQQRYFLETNDCAENALQRYNDFVSQEQEHLALELWKYCALKLYGGMSLDPEMPLIGSLEEFVGNRRNLAVWSDSTFSKTVHGSMLLIREPRSNVASGMVKVLMETSLDVFETAPLLLPRTLYDLILDEVSTDILQPGSNGDEWFLLQLRCSMDLLRRDVSTGTVISSYTINSHRLTYHCPEKNGFCCDIYDTVDQSAVTMTRHPLHPYHRLPPVSSLPKPYNAEAGHYDEDDLPFISTVREEVMQRPDEEVRTPNFFEILLQNDCLPSDLQCSNCLRDKRGADCHKCMDACPCFCRTLCHIAVDEKFVSKELMITPPLYARDPSRLVPRIVHQTWFEEVSAEKYPHMSRLIESFKQSGWEYKFYTDDDAKNFLSTHFPPEIRAAYDTLRPGAFKADLFRYCVLLIHGGVYADMDIMLESNLDEAVGPDVGFMVPVDEPGTPINRRMCLWNGFIATAPAHPFLAKVIESVVNGVRNRFTSVDNDNTFCPDPEMSVLHAFDTLFTAGPCILGASLNRVLGRHGQTHFEAGELDPWEESRREASEKGTIFVVGVDDQPELRIPGRTIILHQNKWDMGAHRFTFLEKNMVVSATDLPDADDRANLENNEHYSKVHVKTGVYGLNKLYVDSIRANEDIRLFVNARRPRVQAQV